MRRPILLLALVLTTLALGPLWPARTAPARVLSATGRPAGGQAAWALAMTPVADTWIEVAYPPGIGRTPNAVPQGANPLLHAGWWDYGINERSVLRFALPTPAPDTLLARAELELAVVSAVIGTFDPPPIVSGTMRLSLYPVTSAWEETTLSGWAPPATGPRALSADVAWGPCADGHCGSARLDVLDLARAWAADPAANHGLVLDATGLLARPSTGASFVVASRESDRPPLLRLELVGVPLGETPTATPVSDIADLRGSAGFDCARGGVALVIENAGLADAGPFAVISTAGARWELDGLARRTSQRLFDPGSAFRSYRIDPDNVVPESDEANNVVSVAIPGCPTPTPGGRAWLPLAEVRRGGR